MQQQQMQLEMQKLQAELQGKQLDIQGKMIDARAKQTQAQISIEGKQQDALIDAAKAEPLSKEELDKIDEILGDERRR